MGIAKNQLISLADIDRPGITAGKTPRFKQNFFKQKINVFDLRNFKPKIDDLRSFSSSHAIMSSFDQY
jgi:hypothetical protein